MSEVPSFQRRLVTTSFGDVFRLRMSGNLDWKGEISRSELPENIQTTIRELIRQSRLFRFEKTSVTKDLVAHFQDGHGLGVSYDQLLADFGDAKLSSQLIRRSKQRNRSYMMKATHMIGFAVLGLLAIYVTLIAFFNMARPDVKIDFVAKLNEEFIDVPANEKAWPIYRDAWLAHEVPLAGFSEIWHVEKDENGTIVPQADCIDCATGAGSRLAQPGDPEWDAAVAFNESKQELFDEIRLAASLPVLGLELKANSNEYAEDDFKVLFEQEAANREENPAEVVNNFNTDGLLDGALINVLLPHLDRFRKTARHLQFDSLVAVDEGDTERYIENLRATFGIADHASQGKVLVASLVGLAICDMGFDHLEETLVANPDLFSDEQLLEIQNAIQSVDIAGLMRVQGERFFTEDILQRVYSDDGEGDGRMTHEGIKVMQKLQQSLMNAPSPDMGMDEQLSDFIYSAIGPASLVTLASRKESSELLNKWMNVAEVEFNRPWFSRGDELYELEETLKSNELKYAVIGMIMPAVELVDNASERACARRDGVDLALAMYRFHATNDRWPESTDELTPEFIPAIPIDRLTGDPIQFKIVDGSPVVYGLGSDLDDDGGKPIFDYPNAESPKISNNIEANPQDGDWILWPLKTWK